MSNPSYLHHYQLYGLKIATTRSLPNLVAIDLPVEPFPLTEQSVDVTVDLLDIPQTEQAIFESSFWNVPSEAYQQQGFHLWTTPSEDGAYWRLRSLDGEDILDFVLNPDGTQVWGFWSSEDLFEDAVSLLLGGVFGHLLRLRGSVCLHASVAAINGIAIAIAGESGAGKSTLAAAMSAHGFNILADDLAVLSCDRNQLWVHPGYPYLRLWNTSLNALQVPTEGLARVSRRFDKHFLNLAAIHPSTSENSWAYGTQPLPLQAVYILGKRDALLSKAIAQPLPAIAALQQLLTHSYGRGVLTPQQSSAEFQQFAAITQTIPIYKLLRPDNFDSLDYICEMIAEELKLLPKAKSPSKDFYVGVVDV